MAPRSILIIDDDADLRRTVELRFVAAGFDVLQAATGEEGLELARAEKPTAIILDVNMPGIDGYETCRRLRADRRTADLPVVMLTTCSRVGELEEGLRAGVDTYLTKPFDGPELVAEVRRIAAARAGGRRPEGPGGSPREEAAGEVRRLLAAAPRKLGDVARAAPGVLLGRRDDRLVADTPAGEHFRPILFEEDVEPFAPRAPRKFVRLSPAVARSMAPDATIFEECPKVLLRRTAPPLVAALDTQRLVVDKTVLCVAPRDRGTKAAFLLGVLGSRLAAFAFEQVIARSRGGALPWISAAEVERLPLPGPGGLEGRQLEDLIAGTTEEIVRRARQGQDWLAGSAAGLLGQLDETVAGGFGVDTRLLDRVAPRG